MSVNLNLYLYILLIEVILIGDKLDLVSSWTLLCEAFPFALFQHKVAALLQCEFDWTACGCVQDPSVWRLSLCCQRRGDRQHGDGAAHEGEKQKQPLPSSVHHLARLVAVCTWVGQACGAATRTMWFPLHLMCVRRASVATRTERATPASSSTSCFLHTPRRPRTGDKAPVANHAMCFINTLLWPVWRARSEIPTSPFNMSEAARRESEVERCIAAKEVNSRCEDVSWL